MAIVLSDNIKTNAPKPTDSRYLNNLTPYTGVTQANTLIPSGTRYIGLTVNINNVEYWYKDGISDSDLVIKSSQNTATISQYTITGDGSSCGFLIDHSKNRQFVSVDVIQNSTPYSTVYVDIQRPNANCVCVLFDTPPGNGVQYVVSVIG